jgi:hypothetical protein
MSLGWQNMKTGRDAPGTVEKVSGSVKHENGTRLPHNRRKRGRQRNTLKWDPAPTVPLKMIPGQQNMKTGPNALYTAENEFGITKQKNRTRRTRVRRKLIRGRKT